MPASRALVVGAGPAGLMAAEVLAQAGVPVDVVDAMPTAGRKFLLAGRGGLNLTHSEPFEPFLARYGARRAALEPLLRAFDGPRLRAWAEALGVPTFVGSSGRVFPQDMKAAPLLRAWLQRLRAQGVRLHMRERWTGWGEGDAAQAHALRFDTPQGPVVRHAGTVVLALGGASWPRLGSDGAWVPLLRARGVEVRALQPSNCGFEAAWSEHLRGRFAGHALKNVALAFDAPDGSRFAQRGECVLSDYGLEGSLVYAASGPLRDRIAAQGPTLVHLDLLPQRSEEVVRAECAHPRGARSWSTHLKSRLGLEGVKAALLREALPREAFDDPARVAAAIKALPLTLQRPRPIDEAISSAGGVPFEGLDAALMLHALPGVFCAGEMLDWEAPTGGYLLTACFATGVAAGRGAARRAAGLHEATPPAR